MISDSISALSPGWSKWQCYRIKHTVRLQLVNNSESSTVVLRRSRSHATPNYMSRKNDDNAAWFKRYSGNVFIVNSRCDLVSIINLFVSTNDVSRCIVSTKLMMDLTVITFRAKTWFINYIKDYLTFHVFFIFYYYYIIFTFFL